MRVLPIANAVLALLTVAMPLAHVLELPNKFALSGPLWLQVQQHLYRGWGPLLGGPAEIGALLTSIACLAFAQKAARKRRLLALASLAYVGMLVVFFLLNLPVNEAVNSWTVTTLPPDWPQYRLRWEMGHAIAFVLSIVGGSAVVRAHFD
jgi:hypothetical protein